jgi:hypothetical protein
VKFCATHWSALRQAIHDRGLSDLVSKSTEEVMGRTVEELKAGETSKTTFDPLMGAHNAIVSRALDIAGLSLMAPNEDGSQRCPLCWIQKGHDEHCQEIGCKHSFEPWIGYAADDMRKEAIRLGLMAES